VLIEDGLLRDDPDDPDFDPPRTPPPQRLKRLLTDDRPQSIRYLEDLRAVVDEFPDRVLAGEVQGKIDRIGNFYGNDRPRSHLPLHFALLDGPLGTRSRCKPRSMPTTMPFRTAPGLSGWIGGHDKKCLASTVGAAQARNAALLALTLPGTCSPDQAMITSWSRS
jgi:alpha-glucosidase